jgi:hypothetical protein
MNRGGGRRRALRHSLIDRLGGRKPETAWVYAVGSSDPAHPIKIGYTSRCLEERLGGMQTGSPVRLYVLASRRVVGKKEAMEVEWYAHQKHASRRAHGEWFAISLDEARCAIGWKPCIWSSMLGEPGAA